LSGALRSCTRSAQVRTDPSIHPVNFQFSTFLVDLLPPARYFSEFFLLGCLPSWTVTGSAYPNPAPKWWRDMRTHLPLSRAPLPCCRSGLRYVSLPLSGVFRCARGSRDSLNLWRFCEAFLDKILVLLFVRLLPFEIGLNQLSPPLITK
jgi:hypothetical protein